MGDLVMLSAKNVRQLRPSKKLSDRRLGPFKVMEIVGNHQHAYELELPDKWKIHPVFHVSLLEPYRNRPGDDILPALVEVDLEAEEHWEVEAILADWVAKKGNREYLVRWKNFSPRFDSWEPEQKFDAPETIAAHNRNRQDSRPPWKKRQCREDRQSTAKGPPWN